MSLADITIENREFAIINQDNSDELTAYEVNPDTGVMGDRGIGLGKLGDIEDPAVRVKIIEILELYVAMN